MSLYTTPTGEIYINSQCKFTLFGINYYYLMYEIIGIWDETRRILYKTPRFVVQDCISAFWESQRSFH